MSTHMQPQSTTGALKKLLSLLKHYRMSFIAVILLSVFATIAETFAPKVLGGATTLIADGVAGGLQSVQGSMRYVIDFDGIRTILIRVAILYLLTGIGRYFQQVLLSRAVQGTIAELRQTMRDKLNRLPISTLDQTPNGEILSRAINDVENLAGTLQQNISQAITSVTSFVGVVGMVLVINWRIGLMMLAAVLVAILAMSFITPISQRLFTTQQHLQGRINSLIEEDYNGLIEIQSFNQQAPKMAQFEQETDAYYQTARRAQFIAGFMFPSVNFIRNINYVLIAFVGGMQVMNGRLPLGDVQALLQYNPQLFQPVSQMSSIVNQIQSTLASAERVFEFLEQAEMTNPPSHQAPIQTDNKVIFQGIDFGYDPERMILKDFTLDVKPGEMIAIVGPTGAGKTTLINLLERFYDVNQGSIKIDGTDIRDWSRSAVRAQMGMVLQDTWLFHGTIYDNIAYGAPDPTTVSPEAIYDAARTAHVEDFVAKLPDGYDTIINEDASNISQGQRQLITIARALVATPDILIMDEATSNIDTRTEKLIQQATDKLLQGRTSFVIAHRLSTIQDADQIIVLEDGRIVEKGNHDTLMKQKGFYYNLYQAQFNQAM